jgi:hypothetical protein
MQANVGRGASDCNIAIHCNIAIVVVAVIFSRLVSLPPGFHAHNLSRRGVVVVGSVQVGWLAGWLARWLAGWLPPTSS